MTAPSLDNALATVSTAFKEGGIKVLGIEPRSYPEETIIIVRVSNADYSTAVSVGNSLDQLLADIQFKGFVAVRAEITKKESPSGRLVSGVHDERASQLATLLTARARTSEMQPSLSYLRDIDDNLSRVLSQRHYLIFGRRGAGKTALMLEAKKRAESLGDHTIWINMQTHRGQSAERAALWLFQAICDVISGHFLHNKMPMSIGGLPTELRARIDNFLASSANDQQIRSELPPRVRQLVKRFVEITQKRILLFIDDMHYLSKEQQPQFLDLAHAAIRDSDAWLKVATIRHLSRWYIQHPPTGLQTGHDAAHIDLDLSLQEPKKAKSFLEAVLLSFATHNGIAFLSSLFRGDALDRLILASGGVPRDYIELSAASIREAQKRDKAKQVGVQDVNRAAGNAKSVKISEVDEDVTGGDDVPVITTSLNRMRSFCLDETRFSFFRIDFRDREQHPKEYSLIQSLLDLRLIHLINSSVSEQHSAGRRSEVLMLDLSQFSGDRLKKDLTVLDLEDGILVMKVTGKKTRSTKADSSRKSLEVLRKGPLFELSRLSTHPDAQPIPQSASKAPKATRY